MSKIEVYLNEKQVDNLKSILSQSEMGIHVLFDSHLIHDAFKADFTEEDFFSVDNLKKVQEDILVLLQKGTLREKVDFIRSLDQDAQFRIVRAYFYMIENNLRLNQKRPH